MFSLVGSVFYKRMNPVTSRKTIIIANGMRNLFNKYHVANNFVPIVEPCLTSASNMWRGILKPTNTVHIIR